jgi:hypothetical protein
MSFDKKILITRPDHDSLVHYLFIWNKEVIKLAEDRNLFIKDLDGKNANRELFEKFIKQQKPDLVLLNGHGNKRLVAGYNNEPLIISGENDNILSGSIIHALACDSSSELGPSSVLNGAKAYVGYRLPFILITDKRYISRPNSDMTAMIFKEPALEVQKNLIKGKSVFDSVAKAKEKYKKAIFEYSASDVDPREAEQIRFALFSNMFSLTSSGNGKSSI